MPLIVLDFFGSNLAGQMSPAAEVFLPSVAES